MKKFLLTLILLFGLGSAQTPDITLMYESAAVLEGALDAVTGSSINKIVYLPDDGLVLIFDQLGTPDSIEAATNQFNRLTTSLYDTIQGVPEDEWITFYWSFGGFSGKTIFISRLRPNDAGTYQIYMDGEWQEQ